MNPNVVDRHPVRRARTALVVVLLLVAAACGAEDPYGAMSDAELEYVIPESTRWGAGNPCADADCSGPIESTQLRKASWIVLDNMYVIEGTAGDEGPVRIGLNVARVLRGEVGNASLERRAWGQDVEWVLETLDAGYELWAATECSGLVDDDICYFVAIDGQDRFAGIGYGAGLYFTAPLAREAVDARASSGRQFLEAVLAS